MFSQHAWVVQVEPGTFGSNIQSTSWIGSPAVESRIPMIVRILVIRVLNTVEALTVEPVLSLQELRIASCHFVVHGQMEYQVHWQEALNVKYNFQEIQLTKRT